MWLISFLGFFGILFGLKALLNRVFSELKNPKRTKIIYGVVLDKKKVFGICLVTAEFYGTIRMRLDEDATNDHHGIFVKSDVCYCQYLDFQDINVGDYISAKSYCRFAKFGSCVNMVRAKINKPFETDPPKQATPYQDYFMPVQ